MDLTNAITYAANFINYCKTKNCNYFVVEHTRDLLLKNFLKNDDCKQFRFVEYNTDNPTIICDANELFEFIRLYIKHYNNIDRCRIIREQDMVVDDNEGTSRVLYPHVQYCCVNGYSIYINVIEYLIESMQIQIKEVQEGIVISTSKYNAETIIKALNTLRSIHKDES